jgi:hypothetical protein
MFGQPACGLSKRLGLIAPQAQNGEKSGLGNLARGKLATIGRQHGLADSQRDFAAVHHPDLGHWARLQRQACVRWPRMSTEPDRF